MYSLSYLLFNIYCSNNLEWGDNVIFVDCFDVYIAGTSGAPSLEEEQRMMDRSGSSGGNDRNDKAGGKYSIEDKDESDVVDIDLEENETF